MTYRSKLILMSVLLSLSIIGGCDLLKSAQETTKDMTELDYIKARAVMVQKQLKNRDIIDPRILDAMGKIPREEFVPDSLKSHAYDDGPLPIGGGQTISQPYVVALMTQMLDVKPTDKVLEIGTGSGYQAALLSDLAKEVYTIEIVGSLSKNSKSILDRIGKTNIQYLVGDGYQGWKEHAPFDKILITAAPPEIPQPLIDQLKVGGKIVAPVGKYSQYLKLYEKTASGKSREIVSTPVRFVPMVGEAQKKRRWP